MIIQFEQKKQRLTLDIIYYPKLSLRRLEEGRLACMKGKYIGWDFVG